MCRRNATLGCTLLAGGVGLIAGLLLGSSFLEAIFALALLAAGVIILSR